MKQNLLQSLRLRFALLVALLCSLGTGTAWADDPDYTYTLASGDFTSTTHSKTSGAITWTHEHGAGTESYGWDNDYGFKFGSGKKSYPTSFTLTSSSFTNTIKKIVVTASVNSSKSCKLDVKVGSTTYGSQATINTKNNDTWEFSIADASTVNGAVQLSFSSNTGPLYLKKIEVFYYVAGVTSLSVKTAPTKVRYEVGESLDMSDFSLNADGNTVTSGYTMTMGGAAIANGATLSSAGKKTITVAYGGKEVSQNISVGAVTGIEVTTPPTKTSYDTGDSFDATGMVVTASLSTEEVSEPDTWTKDLTSGYTYSPTTALAPANTSVTITYATKSTTQSITVTDVAVTGVSVKASTTIEKTKTETLTPTFTPTNATNKNVTWFSDATGVATVSAAGVVTGVAAGTANITVTTDDGDFTATCVVTVVNEKGGIDAPYSVAEVIAGTATGSDKYVIGYIVGSYNATAPKTGADRENSNLALADSYDQSDGSKTIPVQLSKDTDPRTYFNVVDHPQYMGVTKVIIKADVATYFSVNGLKNTDEISAVAEAVKVTSAGYATWASDAALNFTGTGINAYIAAANGTKGVNFTQVYKVPANTGVLLYKDGGATATVPVYDGATDDVTGNIFVKGTGATVASVDGNLHNYILNNGSKGIGFYRAAGQTVAKNRAYIQIDESKYSVKEFFSIDFDSIVDGIGDVRSKMDDARGEIFNLAGQKMSRLQKGINIVNGKKVLVK